MSELADCVNIGKSTLYEYFSNKDEIVKAALMKYVQVSIDSVDISDEIDGLSFEQAFKKQLKLLLTVATESRTVLEALSPGFVQKLPDSMKEDMKLMVEKTRQMLLARFTSYFIKGMEEGIIPPENDVQKAFVVTSLVIGSIVTFSEPSSSFEIESSVNSIYDAAIKILN